MIYLGKDPVGLATSIPEFANIAKMECGTFIVEQDTLADGYIINHNLGIIPDFFMCYPAETFITDTDKNYLVQTTFTQWPTQEGNDYYAYINYALPMSLSGGGYSKSTLASGSSFKLYNNKSLYLKANIKYFYIVGKYKEVTVNANE